MGNILVKDGQLVFDDGKIVVINSEGCDCCEEECREFCNPGSVPATTITSTQGTWSANDMWERNCELDITTEGYNVPGPLGQAGECWTWRRIDKRKTVFSGLSQLNGTYGSTRIPGLPFVAPTLGECEEFATLPDAVAGTDCQIRTKLCDRCRHALVTFEKEILVTVTHENYGRITTYAAIGGQLLYDNVYVDSNTTTSTFYRKIPFFGRRTFFVTPIPCTPASL